MKATILALAAAATLSVLPAAVAAPSHAAASAAVPAAQILTMPVVAEEAAPDNVRVAFGKHGYYGDRGYRHHRKFRRYGHRRRHHFGPRVGDVRIVERPCATRVIRFTPFGREVSVIRHCGGRKGHRHFRY